ncbi:MULTISPECIES: 30S ribosomal protein S4 [Tepidanaerobacter]|uniref:Small ribosomal subunit protein uS4 n=1 Tax=Tepidanaerobacter syntrophicus TaxID=224999 RepID=A0A0U9HEX8_9FIRM|nr:MULTISPECIES: 30S ribosomal protein S4 [Tepidanaerobacter]GAQ24667.1 small subunit ribosomal protein S4 [Tepidanaerobacter syntrophicus]GLI19063.1 30S ribosomal protein S4 [Tepidanaerobacter syntrophicus]GLI51062.1 30S ribosomal protein S4 [Tepidanaerobacter syntrophicus]HHV83418.1 30S ribosomal protein S4 [Tepidanaerobacter syntrophicus]
MARYKDAVCRLCRREGMKLYLKGDRCYSPKCAMDRRGYAPGQHGQLRRKPSEYGLQLREKQKARRIYGIMEKQFANYYEKAVSQKGVTGENLLRLLETRLDNVIYRMGFAASRPQARQLVRYGHVEVNGKRVTIPSYQVKEKDVVAIREKSRNLDFFKEIAEQGASKVVPAWLSVNFDTLTGEVLYLPKREDIDVPIQEHLIVELYSK